MGERKDEGEGIKKDRKFLVAERGRGALIGKRLGKKGGGKERRWAKWKEMRNEMI